MDWIKPFAQTVIAVAGAGTILWGAGSWVVGPRLIGWAEALVAQTTAGLREEVQRLNVVVEALAATVSTVQANQTILAAPAWQWDPVETTIGDGAIGGFVEVTMSGLKLRNCGAPLLDMYFVNGGGLFHRFRDVSIHDEFGRGVPLPVESSERQQITFTARIPANEYVETGRAVGYITVSYPDLCPNTRAEISGPLQFWIVGRPEATPGERSRTAPGVGGGRLRDNTQVPGETQEE